MACRFYSYYFDEWKYKVNSEFPKLWLPITSCLLIRSYTTLGSRSYVNMSKRDDMICYTYVPIKCLQIPLRKRVMEIMGDLGDGCWFIEMIRIEILLHYNGIGRSLLFCLSWSCFESSKVDTIVDHLRNVAHVLLSGASCIEGTGGINTNDGVPLPVIAYMLIKF